MRIERHVALRSNSRDFARLKAAGLEFGDENEISSTRLYEDDPRWPRVAAILINGAERRALCPKMTDAELLDLASITFIKFDEPERLAAPWLGLRSLWTNGYPQPESEWKARTFDAIDDCQACGITGPQTSPYRMSKAPKWGRRWLAGLFWASDALFARRDVYDAVFAPRGVPGREVLLHKGGEAISDTVQLAPTQTVALDSSGLASSECAECGRRKYEEPSRSFLPPPLGPVEGHAFVSEQWFGPDAMAFKIPFFSQEIYRELKDLEGRQVVWHPVGRVSEAVG